MAELLDDMRQAAEDLIGHIGSPAIFHPTTGPPVSCNIWVGTSDEQMPGGYDAAAESQVTEIRYLLSEVGKVAERGELFILDGSEYRVESVPIGGDEGDMIRVFVK